jgi:hypothetical protein
VTSQNRRRIDQIEDPDFLSGIESVSSEELRDRRVMCDELDLELSYYRRMLHGRMDLVAFQMRRLAGEEESTLIDALPRILAEGAYTVSPGGLPARAVAVEAPDIERKGRRPVDKALDGDFIMRLPSLSMDALREIQMFLEAVESDVSRQRRSVHHALDTLQSELTRRYRDETPGGGDGGLVSAG